MTQLVPEDWDRTLLSLPLPYIENTPPLEDSQPDTAEFIHAFEHCASITAAHSKSFYMAARLLPTQKRKGIHALYAYCRTADDIADLTADTAQALDQLEIWKQSGTSGCSPSDDLILSAWNLTRLQYGIPDLYIHRLIDTLQRDLHQHRYRTFDELTEYCFGVASTVGLMSICIIGSNSVQASGYAIKLGIALQMTNILRDIREDWIRGRLYLSLIELADFGLDENDIDRCVVTSRWREFMRFQIARTRAIYRNALEGVQHLNPGERLAGHAAAAYYAGILTRIERQDYDVFSRRAFVSRAQKWSVFLVCVPNGR